MIDLKTVLAREKIAAILITSPENIYYLTGFGGSFGQCLCTPQKNYLITDFRYRLRAEKEIQNKRITGEIKVIDISQAQKIIPRYRQIFFEEEAMTVAFLKRLQKIYPAIKWRGINRLIERIRLIKEPEEIKWIRKAAQITDTVFQKIMGKLKVGFREKELSYLIEKMIREEGGDLAAFPPIVAFGKNSAEPHHASGDKKLKPGEMILLDFGASYHHYCSDMTRIIFTAPPSFQELKIYNLVFTIQEKALRMIKPGIKIAAVDKMVRDHIAKQGYGKNFGHALGHGVGLQIHEEPKVSFLNKDRFLKGMVITIEPGIYLKNKFGMRIEDLVVISDQGVEILSRTTKKILIVPI